MPEESILLNRHILFYTIFSNTNALSRKSDDTAAIF